MINVGVVSITQDCSWQGHRSWFGLASSTPNLMTSHHRLVIMMIVVVVVIAAVSEAALGPSSPTRGRLEQLLRPMLRLLACHRRASKHL